MDTGTLKRMRIGSDKTFNRLVRLGWFSQSGAELSWRDWANRKGREDLGRVGSSFISIPLPAAKTDEEKAEARQLAVSGKEWRVLRTNSPVRRDR